MYRKYQHDQLTFRTVYAFSENYVLPLSHDEVVHGKGSLIAQDAGRLSGRSSPTCGRCWATCRAQPGKKLLFMGGEFAQWREWNHDAALDWELLEFPTHRGLQHWVEDLNRTYREEPALHRLDCEPAGYQWVDAHDSQQSTVACLRLGWEADPEILIVVNFTPVPRTHHHLGVPRGGFWKEILNSDAEVYGGSGWGNLGGVEASPCASHGRPFSVSLTLPPLASIFLRAP